MSKESSKVRFCHLADLHLGAFRERRLTELNFRAFELAICRILEIEPEFVLFAGDVFNSAMPPIDLVERVVRELMKLKEVGIPIFVIGGSHDFSSLGKSFLSLLDASGVVVDVCKPKFVDEGEVELYLHRFGRVVVSGILGKKNGLDRNLYRNLKGELGLSKEDFNVFMFHASLDDFKPKFMGSVSSGVSKSFLPEGFDFYAGGHVHCFMEGSFSVGKLSYPGPLFPNSFVEFLRERPSFSVCEFDFETRDTSIRREFLKVFEKVFVKVEVDCLSPSVALERIEEAFEGVDVVDRIVLFEVLGVVDGRVSDVGISRFVSELYDRGAFVVLKNSYKLSSKEVAEVDVDVSEDVLEVERRVVEGFFEESEELSLELCEPFLREVLGLDLVRGEEEKVGVYEERVLVAMEKCLKDFE